VAYDGTRLAVGERDSGVRKISRITWRAGLTGVALSALFVVAFGHRSDVTPQHHQPDQIITPGQPPQPASGGGQVTSGGS
jgi:hypothetical protein